MPDSKLPLQDVRWLAARTGEKVPALYEAARAGLIPHIRIGRKIKFDPATIEAWIAAGGTALPGGWRREAD